MLPSRASVLAAPLMSCALSFLAVCGGSSSTKTSSESPSYDSGLGPDLDAGQPTPPAMVDLATGGGFSCALSKEGEVYCWGSNTSDELGTASSDTCQRGFDDGCSLLPLRVTGVAAASGIEAGATGACATIRDSEDVWCWGDASPAYAGNAGADALKPVSAASLSGAKQVGFGGSYACVLLADGTVSCVGEGELGQLGSMPSETCSEVPCSTTLLEVAGLSGVKGVASGSEHSCALLGDGTVRCWGLNEHGQLGAKSGDTCMRAHVSSNDRLSCSLIPVVVEGLSDVTAITAGAEHTCALRADGTVWCWGSDRHLQLGVRIPEACGDDNTWCSVAPVQVEALRDIRQVVAGYDHTCALDADANVLCWGDNEYGQLGVAVAENTFLCGSAVAGTLCTPTPQRSAIDALSVAPGAAHTCVLHVGGTVECFGSNSNGQLGDGTGEGSREGTTVKFPIP